MMHTLCWLKGIVQQLVSGKGRAPMIGLGGGRAFPGHGQTAPARAKASAIEHNTGILHTALLEPTGAISPARAVGLTGSATLTDGSMRSPPGA